MFARGRMDEQRRRRRARTLLVSIGVGVALLGLASPLPLWARAAIAAIGLACALAARFVRRPDASATSLAYVEAHGEGLSLVSPAGKKSLLSSWDAPFGVVLLASYGRPVALLAITTTTQTRYVPARIDDREEHEDDPLAKVAVLADLDLIDGVTHEAALSSDDARKLVRHLRERNPSALGRVFANDGKRGPISLDRSTLVVGNRSFDLTSALEWRPLMFHEVTGQAAPLYQATWIRQESNEVVLVAPMPASIIPRDVASKSVNGKLGQALTRDLKLLHAHAETPPIRELRVPIDRPFMLAVRRVLDDAPLAVRVSLGPVTRPSPERRGSLV